MEPLSVRVRPDSWLIRVALVTWSLLGMCLLAGTTVMAWRLWRRQRPLAMVIESPIGAMLVRPAYGSQEAADLERHITELRTGT